MVDKTYWRMSHLCKNWASAEVVGRASGSVKSMSGIPSAWVAIANSSRSLRLREATIALKIVRNHQDTPNWSEKFALSIETILTCILPVLIAVVWHGRRARPQWSSYRGRDIRFDQNGWWTKRPTVAAMWKMNSNDGRRWSWCGDWLRRIFLLLFHHFNRSAGWHLPFTPGVGQWKLASIFTPFIRLSS